jgi:hypothetical protein
MQESMRVKNEEKDQKNKIKRDIQIRELAWRDVREYQMQQREARRKSMAWRIAESRRQHEVSNLFILLDSI